ncbi:MAG: hypothetical protein AAF936_08830 [Pseudomonadota bacterium]
MEVKILSWAAFGALFISGWIYDNRWPVRSAIAGVGSSLLLVLYGAVVKDFAPVAAGIAFFVLYCWNFVKILQAPRKLR